jgi:hypothetical protein
MGKHYQEGIVMKKSALILALVAATLCCSMAMAQFKSTVDPRPTVSESILRTGDGNFLSGLLDPNKFMMHHSFSLSYASFAGQGMSLGMYTNSMQYKFSDDLDIRTDISLMTSPFNSLSKEAQGSLNGLFLNRAELNYRPWKNTLVQISYRQYPASSWLGNGYGYGFGGMNSIYGIDRFQDDIH